MEFASPSKSAVATPTPWPTTASDAAVLEYFPELADAPLQPAVLVVPDGPLYLAFRLLRIFHEAGVAVDLLCPAGHPLARSRYVRQVCEARDWFDLENIFARLLSSPQRPWSQFIVAHEPSARRLYANLDDAALAAWQPGLATPGVREFCLGKLALPAAQARWDLPIPPSRVCFDTVSLQTFAEEIGGPVIVKPPDQLGGNGIQKFANAHEVAAAGRALQFPLLAQQFISGRRVVLDLFCSGGNLLGWLSSYSIAQHRGPFSYSTARHFLPMPKLRPLAETIAACSRFEGFCGVDCLEENSTGRIYLLEFNSRLTSGWRNARHCGVDVAPAVAAWVNHSPPSPAPLAVPGDGDVLAHYFPTDLARCWRQRDWRGLKNWLPGARSHHDWCLDDWRVLLAAGQSRWRGRNP